METLIVAADKAVLGFRDLLDSRPTEEWLPTIPYGFRQRENCTGRSSFLAQLKFEKGLVEGALENVRDVGSFNMLGCPGLVFRKFDWELLLVQAKCVPEIRHSRLIATVKIHRLDFDEPIPVDL